MALNTSKSHAFQSSDSANSLSLYQDERTKEIHNKVGEDVTMDQLPEETEDGSRTPLS
ncbi:hypothetical protein ACE6H2_024577 [Prunus campanulata]